MSSLLIGERWVQDVLARGESGQLVGTAPARTTPSSESTQVLQVLGALHGDRLSTALVTIGKDGIGCPCSIHNAVGYVAAIGGDYLPRLIDDDDGPLANDGTG
ncbi:hypothetical protein [Nocardia asiatica]|uniref:hypothetical protein n=1 Tax=Nocardia asiatica TaxID=209252 RepID=UPI0005C25643|nr:hypothetical protein [Nocardia asiatica]